MQTTEILWASGVLATAALAAGLAQVRRRRRIPARLPEILRGQDDVQPPDGSVTDVPEPGEMLRHTLRRDLQLAAEHLQSIRWLLEIATQHQQPIPKAALTNLDLVSKQLGQLQKSIEPGADEAVTQAAFSASAHRPEIPLPRHPQPSFESRVSPFDRSGPFD